MAKEFNGGLLLFDWRDLTFTENVATDTTIQIWNPTDEDYDTYGESYYRLLQAKNKKVVYIALPKGIKNASLEYDSDNDVFNLYADSDIYEIENDGTITHSSILDEVDLSDYYTKTQVDTKLGDKLNKASELGEFGYDEDGYPLIKETETDTNISIYEDGLFIQRGEHSVGLAPDEDNNLTVDGRIVLTEDTGQEVNPTDLSNIEETFSATPTGHQLPNSNQSSLTQEQVTTIKNNMLYWIKKGYFRIGENIYKIGSYLLGSNRTIIKYSYSFIDENSGSIVEGETILITLYENTQTYSYMKVQF